MEDFETAQRTLYVKNFDRNVCENTLKCIFGLHGLITKVTIIRNEKGSSRGFGFVTFADQESAIKALEACHGWILYGKSLFVQRAKTKAEMDQMTPSAQNASSATNLYIKQLDPRVDDHFLRTIFSVYGNVLSAEVIRTESGESRCFGFVSFSTGEDAYRALENLNGRKVFGSPLCVKVAQRAEDRKEILESVWSNRKSSGSEEKSNSNVLHLSETDFPRLIKEDSIPSSASLFHDADQ